MVEGFWIVQYEGAQGKESTLLDIKPEMIYSSCGTRLAGIATQPGVSLVSTDLIAGKQILRWIAMICGHAKHRSTCHELSCSSPI